MIDFHNHIIPGLDDGSKSIEMSLSMLKEAKSQGITEIINTVHFQHPKMFKKNTSYNWWTRNWRFDLSFTTSKIFT